MKIVIKKRIDLDFLGDDYKEGYLTFRSISVSQFEKLSDEIEKLEDKKAAGFLLSTLEKQFVEGQFPDETGKLQDVATEDLKDIDLETVIKVFNRFTGQDIAPKVEMP